MRLREVPASISVVEVFIFREHAPLRIEVVVQADTGLPGKATVVATRVEASCDTTDVDVDVIASLTPPSARADKDVRLKATPAVRGVVERQVSHERCGVEQAVHARSFDVIYPQGSGRID